MGLRKSPLRWEGDGDGKTAAVVDPNLDLAFGSAVGDAVEFGEALGAGMGDGGRAGSDGSGGNAGIVFGLLICGHGLGKNEARGSVLIGEAGAVVVECAADEKVVGVAAFDLIAGVFPADGKTGEVGLDDLIEGHGCDDF